MAQHEEIIVWLDRRWKEAIEHHLKDETLQEHLENVLDELCNQLPEREYKRISREIWEEDRMARRKRRRRVPIPHTTLWRVARNITSA